MNGKMIWMEYLRAIACIMVVIIHVASEFILKGDGGINWSFANFFDSLARVCVPIFFMISGYLFFNTRKVSQKNYIKVVTALLFYSSIAIIIKLVLSLYSPALADKLPLHYNFLAEPSIYHLWYFYPLIIIYLISNLVKVREINFLQGLGVITLLFTFFNPKLNDLLEISINFKFTNYFFIEGEIFYFVLYAVLGGCFYNLRNLNINYGRISFFLYLIVSILIAVFTNSSKSNTSFLFYEYTGILVFFASLCFFASFYLCQTILKPSRLVSLISRHSLAIYGIHAFVVSGLSVLTKFYKYPFMIAFPVIIIMVLLCSLCVSILIKKIDTKGYIS